jgi:hypothetical protein
LVKYRNKEHKIDIISLKESVNPFKNALEVEDDESNE